ncbi:manganese/zinc/iron transport system permease protein [Thermolongibacillus altinsuensis]|jgi:manganese/zinc/iron transport system permease protein|uniref:Manganese/zinc/iron transport system permease protein n=1 Tax=Thermolongibacillus altinsuensis TaxID=575256 RepID=A0A4V2QA50_9BACL|nr:metal ABC transporter permease [Thermolongibacillus altinsuensis]TCL48396.1 manganese/zinc/iron transport system permease protein [Thermolongibacillus altinsuensis]
MSYTAWILLTGALVGVNCGLVGTFLVLRKMAMLSDAISHSVLLGIVGAYLVSHQLQGPSMLIGALIVGLLTAFFVQFLHQSGVQADAAIGVVFTALFAVGVILISLFADRVHLDVEHALMGEIAFVPWDVLEINGVTLGPKAVWLLGFVLIVNLFVIIVGYKELKISSFDPEMAMTLGIPVLFIHYVLMGMLSLTTVASFDSVGAILVVAMLIVPSATAYLWTDRLSIMLVLSALFGVLSSFIGYIFAAWLNVSISGSMAVASGVLFTLTFFFSPKHGLIGKWLQKRQSPTC